MFGRGLDAASSKRRSWRKDFAIFDQLSVPAHTLSNVKIRAGRQDRGRYREGGISNAIRPIELFQCEQSKSGSD